MLDQSQKERSTLVPTNEPTRDYTYYKDRI